MIASEASQPRSGAPDRFEAILVQAPRLREAFADALRENPDAFASESVIRLVALLRVLRPRTRTEKGRGREHPVGDPWSEEAPPLPEPPGAATIDLVWSKLAGNPRYLHWHGQTLWDAIAAAWRDLSGHALDSSAAFGIRLDLDLPHHCLFAQAVTRCLLVLGASE